LPIYLENNPIYSPIILKSHGREANTINNFIKNNVDPDPQEQLGIVCLEIYPKISIIYYIPTIFQGCGQI